MAVGVGVTVAVGAGVGVEAGNAVAVGRAVAVDVNVAVGRGVGVTGAREGVGEAAGWQAIVTKPSKKAKTAPAERGGRDVRNNC
jgi:hypothetical protein